MIFSLEIAREEKKRAEGFFWGGVMEVFIRVVVWVLFFLPARGHFHCRFPALLGSKIRLMRIS